MRIKFVQDIIDTLRRKKERKKEHELRIPRQYQKDVYRLKGGLLFSKKYDAITSVMKVNKSTKLFYEDLSEFNVANVFVNRYKKQKQFLLDYFIPKLKSTDILCDIGPADAEFTFLFSDYCNKVEGYELSQKMVDIANNNAIKLNKTNTKFYQADVKNIREILNKKYNVISIMGVLTYIIDDKEATDIINCLAEHLLDGGYIVVKDNLNYSGDNFYFFGGAKNDYYSIARSKNKYLKMFLDAGFELVNDTEFDMIQNPLQICETQYCTHISYGAIFKRKEVINEN